MESDFTDNAQQIKNYCLCLTIWGIEKASVGPSLPFLLSGISAPRRDGYQELREARMGDISDSHFKGTGRISILAVSCLHKAEYSQLSHSDHRFVSQSNAPFTPKLKYV